MITGWNGLAVSALLEAARACKAPRFRQAGLRALDAMLKARVDGRGRVHRTAEEGELLFLEDAALLLRACTDAHAATGRARYLSAARKIAARALEAFATPSGGLRDRDPEPGEPLSPAVDRFVPSGNGVMAQALTALAAATGTPGYRKAAGDILRALGGEMLARPARTGALARGLRIHVAGGERGGMASPCGSW